jgi:hypothetical protein
MLCVLLPSLEGNIVGGTGAVALNCMYDHVSGSLGCEYEHLISVYAG